MVVYLGPTSKTGGHREKTRSERGHGWKRVEKLF